MPRARGEETVTIVCTQERAASTSLCYFITPFYSFTYCFLSTITTKPCSNKYWWWAKHLIYFFSIFRPRAAHWADFLEFAVDCQSDTYNDHSCENMCWHHKFNTNLINSVRKIVFLGFPPPQIQKLSYPENPLKPVKIKYKMESVWKWAVGKPSSSHSKSLFISALSVITLQEGGKKNSNCASLCPMYIDCIAYFVET